MILSRVVASRRRAAGARTTPSIRQGVQGATYDSTSGTTQSVTLTGVLAGSTILVFSTGNAGSSSLTISDGTAYTQLHSVVSPVDSTRESCHILENSGGGNLTITQTYNASISYRGLVAIEVQSCATASLIDSKTAGSAAGVSGTDALTTASMAAAGGDINALLVGFVMNVYGNNPARPNAGSASTLYAGYLLFGGNNQSIVTSRDITGAGSYAGVFSPVSNSDYHTGFAVLLRGSP